MNSYGFLQPQAASLRPLAFLLALMATTVASSQPSATAPARSVARQLGQDGIDAYQAEKFAVASEKLEKAFTLYSTPTLAFWSARALVRTGRWVEAAERYREAIRVTPGLGDSSMQKEAQRDAALELKQLLQRVPSITLDVEGAVPAEVTVTFDDVPVPSAMLGVPWPIDPGTHQIVVARRSERKSLTIKVVESERKRASIRFDKTDRQGDSADARHPSPKPATDSALPPASVSSAKTENLAPTGRLWHGEPRRGMTVISLSDASIRLVVPNLNGRPSTNGDYVSYVVTTREASNGTPISELVVADAANGKLIHSAWIIGFLAEPRVSPKDKRYVLVRFKADDSNSPVWEHRLYDVQENKLVWQRDGHQIDWLADGTLVTLTLSGQLTFGVSSSVQLPIPAGFYPTHFAVNRQATKLAIQMSRVDDPTLHDIWISNFDGSGLVRLTQTEHSGYPTWSPDGRYVAFGHEAEQDKAHDGTSSRACQLFYAPVSAQGVTRATASRFQLAAGRTNSPKCPLLAWTE